MGIWKVVWPYASQILAGVWNEIVGVIKIAWSLVSGIIKIGLDLMSGNWSQAWTDCKDMLAGVWDGIKTLLSGALQIIEGILSGAGAIILAALEWPFQQAWNYISGIFGNIQNIAGQIGSFFGGLFGGGGGGGGNGGNLPHHASGIRNSPAGLAVVGENGPEIINLHQGDDVVPQNQWNSLSPASSGGGGMLQNVIYVQLDGNQMGEALINYVRLQEGVMM